MQNVREDIRFSFNVAFFFFFILFHFQISVRVNVRGGGESFPPLSRTR